MAVREGKGMARTVGKCSSSRWLARQERHRQAGTLGKRRSSMSGLAARDKERQLTAGNSVAGNSVAGNIRDTKKLDGRDRQMSAKY